MAFSQTEWNRNQIIDLLTHRDEATELLIFQRARALNEAHYHKQVFLRGLIEISNYCKNDCLYCGIRRSNRSVSRYRLSENQILEICRQGYESGFRTFVLQGGEDGFFTDALLVRLIKAIKQACPDAALTLSLGEKRRDQYLAYYEAGADRYLLRFETSTPSHYAQLHPSDMDFAHRIACLHHLKEVGYQVGTGFMVGSPFQTIENLADDLCLLAELQPQMVGIGPFISHHQTPFANAPCGSVDLTLLLLALIRNMLPKVLLPATTALGTLGQAQARSQAILAGANVIMPNLSPMSVREKYMIYDEKNTSQEAIEFMNQLRCEVEAVGYHISMERGDALM